MAKRKQGTCLDVAEPGYAGSFTQQQIAVDIVEHTQLNNRYRQDRQGVKQHARNKKWFVASTSRTKTTFAGFVTECTKASQRRIKAEEKANKPPKRKRKATKSKPFRAGLVITKRNRKTF